MKIPLWKTWRHNIPIHGTVEVKRVETINDGRRKMIKLQGNTEDDIEIYADIELLGAPEALERYKLDQGVIAAIIIRAVN
jgi:hypothetical protein